MPRETDPASAATPAAPAHYGAHTLKQLLEEPRARAASKQLSTTFPPFTPTAVSLLTPTIAKPHTPQPPPPSGQAHLCDACPTAGWVCEQRGAGCPPKWSGTPLPSAG